MAFRTYQMISVSPGGGSGGSHWLYKTEDDVTVADYFTPFAGNLSIGDRIFVTVVTNLNQTNEAFVSAATYVVTSAGASIVVAAT